MSINSQDYRRVYSAMLKDLCLPLMIMLVAVVCCSCDMASTARYSVEIGIDDRIDHKQVVQLSGKAQVARVYQIAVDVASKYGLEKCDGGECLAWDLSCDKFKENSCLRFAAPGGNVRGHGAPGMLIYTQDETHVIILIRYFVGPSEPFTNFGRDLRAKLKDQPGVTVTLSLD